MTREEEVILAGKAKEILDNPAWQQILANWQNNLSEAMADHCQDDKALKEIAHSYQAVRMLVRSIEDIVMTGKMASLQISE